MSTKSTNRVIDILECNLFSFSAVSLAFQMKKESRKTDGQGSRRLEYKLHESLQWPSDALSRVAAQQSLWQCCCFILPYILELSSARGQNRLTSEA